MLSLVTNNVQHVGAHQLSILQAALVKLTHIQYHCRIFIYQQYGSLHNGRAIHLIQMKHRNVLRGLHLI